MIINLVALRHPNVALEQDRVFAEIPTCIEFGFDKFKCQLIYKTIIYFFHKSEYP